MAPPSAHANRRPLGSCAECAEAPATIKGLCRRCYARAYAAQFRGTRCKQDCGRQAALPSGLCKVCHAERRAEPCVIDGCSGLAYIRGLCRRHYRKKVASRPCEAPGCTSQSISGGLCGKHYAEKRGECCAVEGCEAFAHNRGWCAAHYGRWQIHGDPLGGRFWLSTCSAKGCGRPHYAKGLCVRHYRELPKRRAKRSDYQKRKRAADPKATSELDRYYSSKRRARLYGNGVEQFNPTDIFERDGWRCQIPDCCFKSRAVVRKSGLPKSVTLDHIIPLSLGGAHVPENTQTAHARCNSRKCNTGVNDQLRLAV